MHKYIFIIISQSGKLIDSISDHRLQEKIAHRFPFLESMDLYLEHFSLNVQGTFVNCFQFLRILELHLLLILTKIGIVYRSQEWKEGQE